MRGQRGGVLTSEERGHGCRPDEGRPNGKCGVRDREREGQVGRAGCIHFRRRPNGGYVRQSLVTRPFPTDARHLTLPLSFLLLVPCTESPSETPSAQLRWPPPKCVRSSYLLRARRRPRCSMGRPNSRALPAVRLLLLAHTRQQRPVRPPATSSIASTSNDLSLLPLSVRISLIPLGHS